ncbi:MAG: TolC family protein [Bacteroidales bacterium]
MKRTILCMAFVLTVNISVNAQLKLSLVQCREMALKNNEEMAKADNAYKQAKLDKYIAFASYFPNLSGSATGIYAKDIDMMGSLLKIRGMYMAGVSVSQPLYTGGKIMASNKLANIGLDCAVEVRRKTEADVISEADNAYWTYVAVGEKVKLLEAYRNQIDELYNQVTKSVEVQMATQGEQLRVEAKRSQILYQLQKAINGMELCRMSLCSSIGLDFETEITPTDANIEVAPPQQMDGTITMRPEYQLLLKKVDAQKQQIKIARAEVLPTLGLSAQYTYYGNLKLSGVSEQGPYTQEFKDWFPAAVASLNVPLTNWGKGIKGVKKAKLELENTKLDLQRNERLMNIELQQAIQNVTDGYNMVETAGLGQIQATENLRNMQNNYDVKMCSLTDLLDAQSQWQEAFSNNIEAKTQYKIYESEYLKVSGQLKP